MRFFIMSTENKNTSTEIAVVKAEKIANFSTEKALDTIEKINTVANNCDYARALVVNAIQKNSDEEDWKKPLFDRFGYSKDYLNKLVKVADRFLYLESADVKAIENKGENVYDIMVTKPEIVKGLHDTNDFDFNVSQMLELVFLDDEVLQKELKAGTIKANMTVKAIREVTDKYRTKKAKKTTDNNDKDDTELTACKNDKERIAMCIKLMEAITTDTIKKHKNYTEILKALETFKGYAK